MNHAYIHSFTFINLTNCTLSQINNEGCNELNLYDCYFIKIKANAELFSKPSTGHLYNCYLNDKTLCSNCIDFDESNFELQEVSIHLMCPEKIRNYTKQCRCSNMFTMTYCFLVIISQS